MKEIKWTNSQLNAIKLKTNKILVSAAAGSGKSTVLTERIIRSVTSDDKPADISRLLVVTFTRSASEDLKTKIEKEIRNKMSFNPNNRHLSEQLIKLPSASISTIHGFCYSLIKSNFSTLGLSASMRIADEIESKTIRSVILDELLENAFAGLFPQIPDFATFSENFINDRDDKLAEIFLSVYTSIKNHPNGFDDFEKSIDIMSSSLLNSDDPYSRILCERVILFCEHTTEMYNRAISCFETDENYNKACTDVFRFELEYLNELKNVAEKRDYHKVRDFLSTFSTTRLGIVKSEYKTDEGEYYKSNVRDLAKKKIAEFREKYFCFTDEDIKLLRDNTVSISRNLLAFLREFDKRLAEYKLSHSVLDFNDLEHYAVQLLTNTDGTPSELAQMLSSSYDEIYVDEYQDVNPLQNLIFDALSVSAPIFMVGDIKQSIYAFRGAMPSIFASYRSLFDEYSDNSPITDKMTVFLSDNFRSEKNVTEFANTVSDALFTTNKKSEIFSYRIPYSKQDRLKCNKTEDRCLPEVQILISETSDDNDVQKVSSSSYYYEAEMTANKIAELIEAGTSPSDIAILLRSANQAGYVFEEALRKRNIQVSSDKGISLLECPEVILAICMLNVIDNPYRDIYLTGALKSPLFGVTLDELINIRRFSEPDTPLFDALCAYTEVNDFLKGKRFLSLFNTLREFSTSNTVDRTLWQIYTETEFFSILYDSVNVSDSVVSIRRSNLIQLHKLARDFNASGKSSLYSFVEQLRHMSENQLSPKSLTVESTGVKIISIHQSKGLEFEHCFLCGTSHKINKDDLKKGHIYDQKLGFATRIKDALRLTSSESPYRLAISSVTELTQTDEEMRVLYVALTRAKKTLYICGSSKDFNVFNISCRLSAASNHPMTFITKNTYLDWIMTSLYFKTDLSPRYSVKVYSNSENEKSSLKTSENLPISSEFSKNDEDYIKLYKEIKDRLNFVYANTASSNIPSKISVSRLYPDIIDDYNIIDNNSSLLIYNTKIDLQKDNSSLLDTPRFLSGKSDYSASERGTATHVFMQFCDFDNILNNGTESEISRLVNSRFILNSHAEMINRYHIEKFIRSDIFDRMKRSIDLNREYRFNIMLPASDFTFNEELKDKLKDDYVFVQGVIDCYFTDDDSKTVLLDYKTDSVPVEIRGNSDEEDNFFRTRHALQLSYYRQALKRLTGKNVDETLIYSFALGRCIKIP